MTGPGTYDDHRKFGLLGFNYFDLFANEFNNRGIAFFTYNRRGVTIGNTSPYYDSVDMEKYRKYLPLVETEDNATIISGLKLDKRLLNAKVVLLGWSEGTILAAMVADKKKIPVDAYDRKDGDWIWKNYFRITIEWLAEHHSQNSLPRAV